MSMWRLTELGREKSFLGERYFVFVGSAAVYENDSLQPTYNCANLAKTMCFSCVVQVLAFQRDRWVMRPKHCGAIVLDIGRVKRYYSSPNSMK